MRKNYRLEYEETKCCTRCGKALAEWETRKQCDVCREYKRMKVQRRKRREDEQNKEKKEGYTLDQLAIMARERGISYGQLVQELEGTGSRH